MWLERKQFFLSRAFVLIRIVAVISFLSAVLILAAFLIFKNHEQSIRECRVNQEKKELIDSVKTLEKLLKLLSISFPLDASEKKMISVLRDNTASFSLSLDLPKITSVYYVSHPISFVLSRFGRLDYKEDIEKDVSQLLLNPTNVSCFAKKDHLVFGIGLFDEQTVLHGYLLLVVKTTDLSKSCQEGKCLVFDRKIFLETKNEHLQQDVDVFEQRVDLQTQDLIFLLKALPKKTFYDFLKTAQSYLFLFFFVGMLLGFLEEIIKRILSFFGDDILEKNIRLQEMYYAHSLWGDPVVITLILANFFNKVIQRLPSDGVIYIESCQNGSDVCLTISDSGYVFSDKKLEILGISKQGRNILEIPSDVLQKAAKKQGISCTQKKCVGELNQANFVFESKESIDRENNVVPLFA